jgi:hypothetical protein
MKRIRIHLPWRRARDASSARMESHLPATGVLRGARWLALAAIAALVAAASLVSFAESYRALYEWAHEHGLSAHWSAVWPLQIDVFIAVGELALFVALVDRWQRRSRVLPWAVAILGLAVSVAGNVGHVGWAASWADKATAAVPPLAAAAALAVGLGVLKRVVEHRPQTASGLTHFAGPAADSVRAAEASLRATLAAGNPWSVNQLAGQFSLTRTAATKLRASVLAESNGRPTE